MTSWLNTARDGESRIGAGMGIECILVTGAAGFIGSFLCQRLLEQFDGMVIGLDNLNAYYDVELKKARIEILRRDVASERFVFVEADLANEDSIQAVFQSFSPTVVIHLAAQAGVRYSIENPRAYIDSNIVGFFNVLEACRKFPVQHLIYASSSSVYGANAKLPYSVSDQVDNPVSLYAATKKSNELMAHAYSKLYRIPCTGLRFFTVYGPMGRPDMAYFKFARKIAKGQPIQIYNNGELRRDFTYIGDIVTGIGKVVGRVPSLTRDDAPYMIYNIGSSAPVRMMDFVQSLEHALIQAGVARRPSGHEFLPMQPGDVHQTYADVSELERDFDFRPRTGLNEGLSQFAKWYKCYYPG